MSVLPTAIILGTAAIVALVLVRVRGTAPGNEAGRRAAARVLAIATAVQAVHFLEEVATGMNAELSALFGLPEMSFRFFVAFNVAWLGVWLASIPGLRSGRSFAFFAAWFLGIAGIINGVAHPLAAAVTGAYFPGLVTAPLVGVAGAWLLLRLRRATEVSKVGST